MILTYLALRKIMMKQSVNEFYVSLGLLTYTLLGKQVANQLITKSFMTGLDKLISKQYIIHVDKNLKRRANEYVLDLSALHIQADNEYYSTIETKHIHTILNYDSKDKLSILHFYCYLLTTIMKSGEKLGAGFTSYEDMAVDIGVSRQTISKYMNKLEALKIIFIYRSNDAICINNTVREIPNTYGDIASKNKIINIGKVYEQNFGVYAKKIKSARSSATRSASAKYSIILSDLKNTGVIRYGEQELKEIYETLMDYNIRYNLKEGDDKYKDLTIFQDYEFYRHMKKI